MHEHDLRPSLSCSWKSPYLEDLRSLRENVFRTKTIAPLEQVLVDSCFDLEIDHDSVRPGIAEEGAHSVRASGEHSDHSGGVNFAASCLSLEYMHALCGCLKLFISYQRTSATFRHDKRASSKHERRGIFQMQPP